ncbi:glycogen debranching protein [Candidatus Sumerlaeota bacterium]|nr:glycogen debranching protein [Candidatus Sumerlaeota bacterium]
MTDNLIQEATDRARDVLERCLSPMGIRASAQCDGYTEVWARDSAITLLALPRFPRPGRFIDALRRTLSTLERGMTRLGHVPCCVDTRRVNPTNNMIGSIDSNLWYIIAHGVLFEATGDRRRLARALPSLERAHLWLQYQDSNDCGLLEHTECATWLDLHANRHTGLCVNVLWMAANRVMANLLRSLGRRGRIVEEHAARARAIRRDLNLMFFPTGEVDLSALRRRNPEWAMVMERMRVSLWEARWYLPWFGVRQFAREIDVLGNILAVVCGVASRARARMVLDRLMQVGCETPHPSKAQEPPTMPGDPEWRDYYLNGNLNLPHQYHNGGIWPFIGGFHVIAEVVAGRRARARELLARLAEANRLGREGEWEFNEWLHGVTGRPMGVRWQAWSAGMFLAAAIAVETGKSPLTLG